MTKENASEWSRAGMRRHRRVSPRGRERGQRLSQLTDEDITPNARDESFNGAELSESVLARDWNSPEEDAAWSNL